MLDLLPFYLSCMYPPPWNTIVFSLTNIQFYLTNVLFRQIKLEATWLCTVTSAPHTMTFIIIHGYIISGSHGTWHRGQCTWHRSHSNWHRSHSNWHRSHCTWHRSHCTWHRSHCTWHRSHSTWDIGYNTCHRSHSSQHRSHSTFFFFFLKHVYCHFTYIYMFFQQRT